MVRCLQTLWKVQGEAISCEEIREAILNREFHSGGTAEQWLDSWRREYAKFVEEHMRSFWIEAMQEGAKKVEEKIPGWQFDITEPNVQLWIKQRGEQFVTNATQTQLDGLETVLRRAATSGMNEYELSRVIQSMVGLNWRQSMANLNRYRSAYDRLVKEGKFPRQAEKKALEKAILYSQQQHRYRGYSIAETELVAAYNQGSLLAVKQAQNRGLLGTVVKRWHAVLDEKTCSICKQLNNKTIGIDEKFTYWEKGVLLPINPGLKYPDSYLAPPAHLFCRCWLEFDGISPPDPKKLFDEIKELLFDKIKELLFDKIKDFLDEETTSNPLQDDDRYDTIIEIEAPTQSQTGGAISGATITDPESKRAEAHAERYYGLVRKMKTDCKRIAKNTGYPLEEIKRIKSFIFLEKHDLGDGKIDYFYPSFEMAQSWQRLIEGKDIKPHDLTLLKHEMMESQLMNEGYTQDEAHRITSEKYDYGGEAKKYYDSLKKR